MKIFSFLSVIAAVSLLAGCQSGNTGNILSPGLVQQGVATGVSYGTAKYPQSVPYLRASGDVICSAANGTDLSPTNIVAAIEASNASAMKSPEGVLILNGALTLYEGVWNSYGSNALASQPVLKTYLQATCNGITEGLPSVNPMARRVSPRSENWPLIKP